VEGEGEIPSSSPLPSKISKSKVQKGFFEPTALPGAIPIMVASPALGFSIYFMGLYGTHLGCSSVGLYYTLSAVTMILVRLKSASFMDRVAPIKIMYVAAGAGLLTYAMLFVCGFVDLSLAQPMFLVAGLVYGVFAGLIMPINQAVAVKNTLPSRWGAANSIYMLAQDIGIGFAAFVWGVINDMLGFSASIALAFVFIALSAIAAKICYKKANI
jgi:MFS family permease